MSKPTTQFPQTPPEADPFYLGWRYVWRRDERGQMVHVRVPLTPHDVLHPQEDDFIVQNTAHHDDCYYLLKVIDDALNGRQGLRVFHDLRIDWEVDDLEPHGPDLSLFANVPENLGTIGTLYVKRLGVRPLLVVEVTSPSTREGDRGVKVEEYHRAGVPFYALVDYRPELEQRQVFVMGYHRAPEGYVQVPLDGRGRLWLEPVGLWLAGEGDRAVCFDEEGHRQLGAKETTRGLKHTAARLEEQEGMTEDAIEKTAEERKARVEAEKAQKMAEEKAVEQEKARKLAEDKAVEQEKARVEAEKARKLAEEKAADEAKARKEAEQKNADLAAKFAEMQAELRRLRGEQPS